MHVAVTRSAAANYYKDRYPNRRHPDRRVIQTAERAAAEHGSFEPPRRHGVRNHLINMS